MASTSWMPTATQLRWQQCPATRPSWSRLPRPAGRSWAFRGFSKWTTSSSFAAPTAAPGALAPSSASASIWAWRSVLSPKGSAGATALWNASTTSTRSCPGSSDNFVIWLTCARSCHASRSSRIPNIAMPSCGSARLEVHTAVKRRPLCRRVAPHRQELPWRERRVSFIRLIDEQRRVRFFSESFLVNPTLVHEYVRGKILTRADLLKFTHQDRMVRAYPYVVTKPRYECWRCPATWD
jgi:hypothetical protein